jgi:type I restriction enzyme S subunit
MSKIALGGKYAAYPEYKDSENVLLVSVPTHWQLTRVKYVADLTPKKPVVDRNLDCSFIPMEKLKTDSIVLDETKKIDTVYDGYTYFADNDILMAKVTPCFENKNIAIATGLINKIGFGSSEIYTIRAKDKVYNRFLFYRLQEDGFMDIAIASMTGAGGLKRVPSETVANYIYASPEENEAKKIANFLDHETAKIDTLIEKQQQLIKLLKEKRQAVISHAVTKGFNPKAPMRDSGVEWLGEVPEHWKMVPLKYLCSFSGGGTPSKDNLSYWTGGDIPWVSPKDMKSFWISDTQDKLTEVAVKESSTNFVNAGALLMVVRSGILQRTIPIAINKVQVTLNQDMKALKFNERMDVEYAANYIIGNVSSLLLEWSKEGATVESIEQEYLSGSLIPVPPLEEQIIINEIIKDRMAVFQKLENQAVRGIALLQERRTALISSAVTGKIDVRHFALKNGQPPESSVQEVTNGR